MYRFPHLFENNRAGGGGRGGRTTSYSYSASVYVNTKPYIHSFKNMIAKVILFLFYLKSSKTHTSATPLLLEKGAEVKMKLQDLKLLIDKKH